MFSLWKKPPTRFWSALIFIAVVVLAVWFWQRQEGRDSLGMKQNRMDLAPPTASSVPQPDPADTAVRRGPPPGAGVTVTVPDDAPAEVKAFREWARGYFSAAPNERPGMESRGVDLAREHTKVIASLIRSDPRRAIENAVPMVLRQDLPAAVVSRLEDRLNVRAALQVIGNTPDPSLKPDEQAAPITRQVTTDDGRQWHAFTYGKRAQQGTRLVASLNGVAVDKDFAVSDSPLRVLEIGERPDSSGREVVNQCPVSGIVTPVEPPTATKPLPPVTPDTPAFETPQRIVYVCSGGHFAAVEEQLGEEENAEHWKALGVELNAGAGSGAPTSPFSVPTTWTTGHRRMLYIRATFPNHRVDPQSEAECHDSLRQMCDYVVQASYGRCYFSYTVAPLIVLPYPESWYVQYASDGSAADSLIVNHARTAAKALGYDTSQYEFDVVRWNGSVGAYGGSAFVGAKGIRMKTNAVGTLCHELGHNLGVWHSNFWQTTPPSVIGPGLNLEYGNIFDVMGNSSSLGHYTSFFKNVIGWLPQETFWAVNTSGNYRVHQYDASTANPDKRHSLRIKRDAERNYWCEFRQRQTGNTALMNGLMVTWDSWGLGGIGGSGGNPTTGSNGGAHLLDMTPGSFGNGITDTRNDSALYVGRTYSDTDAGIHVTPISRNMGTSPPSMDVVVNLGAYPGNQNPSLSVGASSTTASTGTVITLTATASDLDGDTLAYAWSFDDGTYSTDNSPTQGKSWSSAGHYRVLCTASDMKGGRTTQGVTITVGSPTTFTVSGTVTGTGGLPVEGVYVANYAPSNLATHPSSSSFRGTWTDSDGNYTLTRLTAGTRTISPNLYPNVFAASGFTNPLVISGNATGINFTSTGLPTITITTTDNQAAEGAVPDPGTVRIQRTGSTTAALSVQVFNTSTGTAVRNTDYTLSPAPTAVSGGSGASEFIMPAGAATLDITVTPVDDSAQEGIEYAVLDFANTAGGYVINGPTSAVVSIVDDNSAQPVVRLSAVDADAAEAGSDVATLRLERNGSTSANLVVDIAYTGSATLGADFSASTSVTIPSGSASTTFQVTPTDDPDQEGTETVTATISTNAAYLRDAVSSSQSVVLVDDDLPTVVIVATDANAAEAGPDPGLFAITRTGGDITQPLTVDYSIAGRAVTGADYLRLDGRAVIPAGTASTSIVIQPVDDAVSEGIQDVICQLRSSTAYSIGAPDQATVNIADDDGPQVYVKLITSAAAEPSSGTSTPIQFQVIRPASGAAITVNYTVGGTATPGTDYTVLPGTVAFTASETSKTIAVTALPDALMEDAESVTLTLQAGAGYSLLPGQDTSATGFIIDQDQPTVDVSVADTGSTLTTVGTEGSSGLRFIVARRTSTASALTVFYTMSGTAIAGVDYASTTGSATIPANATSIYVPITPVNDTIAEGVETIVMNLTASPGTYGQGISSAIMLLGDNDSYASGSVGFATATSTTDESAGTWQIPVNLTGSSGSASVRYRVSGGTATGGGKDHTLAEGTLSFSAGQTSRNITLTIQQDSVPEPAETVIVQLFNVIGANLGGSSHTVTINNVSFPETWTDPASFVLFTSATLNGRVIPNGLATMAWFEYGGSTAYGSTTAPQAVGSGSASVNISTGVSGLSLSGYHFRCVSQNSAGTSYGADQFFGVDATPAVATLAASSVNGTGATLNGTVNANGASTTVTFEYGTSTAYGATITATPSPVSGTADTAVSAVVSGLTPGTLYHYRVRGMNSSGTSVGNDATFTTVNSVPVASFTNAPTTVTARYPVTYAAAATDADGDTLTYTWDFGASYPVQYGATITQTFIFGGTVNLTLTVSDGNGGVATLTRVITVNDPARTWTQMSSGTTDDLTAVAAGGTLLVAVGDRGRILRSSDGVNWVTQFVPESATNIYFQGITWDGQKFIAVGYDYDYTLSGWVGVIYTSSNGATWARRSIPSASGQLHAVAGGAGGTVAVGDNATLLHSVNNGTTWTKVPLPGVGGTESMRGAAYGGGVFTITGTYSGAVKVMSSPNGTSWTDRTSGSGVLSWQDLGKIAWLNNRFVGAGWYSRIRTSTDGAQSFSTTRTSYEETPALSYGDGIYLAAGVNHSASDVDVDVISIDGQTWQSAAAPTTTNRNGATFFNHRFFTVGNLGQIWRSGDLSAPPSILTQPQGSIVLKGDTVQFSVLAIGSNPLTYSWRRNGVAISGATAATYTIASAKETDTGTYTVVVANNISSLTSNAVTLAVNSPAEIVTHPVGGDILVGGAKIFTIVATGDEPVLYQWRKDGLDLEGMTTPTLPLTDIQVEDAGTYDCVVTNDYGTATSNPAFLNVLDKFLALGAATFTVNEDAPGGVLNIPILRTGNPAGTVTVTLTMTAGTAAVGSDFTPSSVPVTIAPGAASVDVPITILNPINTPEVNETFTATLGAPSNGTGLVSPSSAVVVIVDTTALSPAQDTLAPAAPAISFPAAASLVGVNTGAALNITGTATDNKGVKQVQVAHNYGAFTDAVLGTPGAPSTSHTSSLVPTTGLNTVQVKSIDYANRASSVVTRTFTVTRPLVVNVDTALGSSTAGFSPSSFREVGKSLTVTATAKPPTTTPAFAGAIFTGWTLSGDDVANGDIDFTPQRIGISTSALEKNTLTFIFREGLVLTANFVWNPFATMAGSYNGLIRPSATLPDRAPTGAGAEDGSTRSNSTEGFFKATVMNTGAFSGTMTIDGTVLNVAGAFDHNGDARFGTARALTLTVARVNKPSLIVALHIDMVTPGINDKITGTVTTKDFRQSVTTAVSTVDTDRAFYNGTTQVVPATYLGAANVNGTFTAVFPAKDVDSQTAGFTKEDYPQGDGMGTITVTKAGIITVAGTLSDGTAITASSALSEGAVRFPLFVQLYTKLGFLSGFVQLDSTQATSDMAASDLQWLRPFIGSSHYYPNGWPEVIKVDMLGAKYAAVTGQSVLKATNGLNTQAADADGNAALAFNDGQLSETLNKPVNLSTTDVVTKPADYDDPTFTLVITRTTGAISGTFTHSDDTVPTFKGAIYQKGPNAGAYGYFLTKQPSPIDYTGESGGVSLIGQP